MDNNTNKLINNGYLRTPYITKNNGHGTTNRINNGDDVGGGCGGVGSIKDVGTASVISPLLGSETNKSELSETEVMHHSSQQPQQQQQQPQQTPSCANNLGHMKFPTVVYLGTDSGKPIAGGGGSGASLGNARTTLQRNAPITYSTTGASSHSPQTSHQSEWLLKESTLRCRLLVLAVALTVLGAAIGALAIYFAGNYRCQSSAHTAIDKSRNINNITGKCQIQILFNKLHSCGYNNRCEKFFLK